jgi:hypothetical protein
MTNYSDEQLSAFLDNELSPSEYQQCAEDIAANAELQRRVDALRAADEIARDYFKRVDEQADNGALIDLINSAPSMDLATSTMNKVVTLPTKKPLLTRITSLAVAASVLFAVGALWRTVSVTSPYVQEQVLLSELSSGEIRSYDDSRAELVQSWRTSNGEICRELMLHRAEGSDTIIGCWHNHGWEITTLDNDTADYQPASSNDVTFGAERLTPEEERRWLEQH